MRFFKQPLAVAVMAVFSIIGFTAPCFADGAFAGRVLPSNKISFSIDGRKVGQYTAEAPLPRNTLVSCEGRTVARLENVYAVFEDGSQFTVVQNQNGDSIEVQAGKAYIYDMFNSKDTRSIAENMMLQIAATIADNKIEGSPFTPPFTP